MGRAVLVLLRWIQLNHTRKDFRFYCDILICRVSIQPYDRWGFRQNLEGEDEEAFLSMAKKMDRRSEQLKVNKQANKQTNKQTNFET